MSLNDYNQEWEDEDDDDFDEDEDDDGVINIELPTPHKGQQLVLNSPAKWRVLCCGRRWGKSHICLQLALESMLNSQSVAYVTPEFSLGREFYNQILRFIPNKLIHFTSKTDLTIKLITGGDLKFFSGEATRSIRGREFNRVIIDEAAFIPDLQDIWMNVIMPTLATTNGDALFVSTPNGMNFFHAVFMKGKYKEDHYESFHFPSHTSPYVSKEFLETAKKAITEDAFRQEYLAEPMASTGNPFGVHHIKENTITELSKKPTLVYGIDLATSGDYTVIIGLDDDGAMTHFHQFRGEWSLIERTIQELPQDVMKVLDGTAVGDVVFSHLREKVQNLHSFKFTSSSKPNLMRKLIVDVQQNRIKFNEKTAEEMMVFEHWVTESGHPKYEAQSGFHDDCVCALALANYHRYTAFANTNWKLYTA